MSSTRFQLSAIAIAVMALSSCSGEDNNPVDDEGSLTVYVADAPVDFVSAVVIQFVGAEAVREDGSVDSVDFSGSPRSVDLLLTATGDSYRVLDSQEFDEGEYSAIRLLIDTETSGVNFVETDADEDGLVEQYPLTVVGNQVSSSAGFSISEVGGDQLLLDIDLRRSLTGDAGSGAFSLDPVVTQMDPDDTGDLSGTVNTDGLSDLFCEDDDSRVAVYVYAGTIEQPGDVDGSDNEAEPVASGIVANDGGYIVKRLLSGNYTVAFSCQAGLDLPGSNEAIVFSDVQTVSLSAGENSTVNF